MKNFIRSYHNGDVELWRKRFKKNKTALEFFDYATDQELIIVAQCWEDWMVEEVQNAHPRIKFDRQGKLGCGGALNYILDTYLYPTDQDCIFAMDDDLTFPDPLGFGLEYRAEAWRAVEKNIGHVKGNIGLWNLLTDGTPILSYLTKSEVLDQGRLRSAPIKPVVRRANCASFLLNTRKHYGKDIHTTDFNPATGRYTHEDWWMNQQCRLEGVPDFVAPYIFSSTAWMIDAVISAEDRSKSFNHDESLLTYDFESTFKVNVEEIQKDYMRQMKGKATVLPLAQPVGFNGDKLTDNFTLGGKIARLTKENLVPYSDTRKERLEYLKKNHPKNMVVVEDVHQEELAWMSQFRSIISGYTTKVPEQLAERGELLMIFNPQPTHHLTTDELLCYNKKMFDCYMRAARNGSQIKEYESILMASRFQSSGSTLQQFL